MRFAVVGCPRCRGLQVTELGHARATCRRCHAALEVSSLAPSWAGDDAAEGHRALVRLSAPRAGMPIEDLTRVLARVDAERRGTLEDLLTSLAATGEFGRDEVERELRARAVPGEPDQVLDRLLAENRIYEPRPGRYRTL